MPTLIVDQPGRRFGGRLNGRVLIGRLPTNGVPLIDSSVSRLHAWIDTNGRGQHFVGDTGSLTGTWVNGAAINRRQDLHDGDVIRVGKIQMTYLDSDTLPPGVQAAELGGAPPSPNVEDSGVLFDCPCGAPAWVKASTIGHSYQCKQCGRTVRVPDKSNEVAEELSPPAIAEPGVRPEARNAMLIHDPSMGEDRGTLDEHGLTDSGVLGTRMEEAPTVEEMTLDSVVAPDEGFEVLDESLEDITEVEPEPAKRALFEHSIATATAEPETEDSIVCGVCHNAITATDTQTVCPSCGLTYHAECWKENLGCASYGCPQVNALAPPEQVQTDEASEAEAEGATTPPIDEQEPGFPWEFVFLLVGVVGALLSAVSYGIPSLIGLLGTVIYLLAFQDSKRRRPIAWLAVLLCLIGIGGGIYVSHLFWGGWPPIGPWARHAAAPGVKR
jgi:predicted RNA-binding Zn-ribbon protein involved in translation (DUF1610 family)